MRRLSVLLLCAAGCATTTAKGSGELKPFGPAGITATEPPRRLALLIGVERFEDDRFGDLRFTQDDALALGAALSREGFDEIQVLTADHETTRSAVLDALSSLAAKIRSPEDTVLIYVSSHGTLAHPPGRALERFVVFRDSRMHLVTDTALSVRTLLQRVEALPSSRKAMVLATCHSGAGKSRLPDPLVDALSRSKSGGLPDLLKVSEAMVVVSAAAFGETARESARLGHDIYTYFLIEGLQKGDRNGDGAVTISEAHDYARERTYAFSDGSQRPTLVGQIVGADPLILAGKRMRAPRPVLFSYSPAAEGLSVVVDGETKGHLPGGVAVEAGRMNLQLIDRQSGVGVWQGDIDIDPGTTTDVATLLPPAPTFSAQLEARSAVLLDATVRDRAFPPLFGAGVRISANDLLIRRLVLEVGMGAATGSGELRVGDDGLPQTVTAIEVSGAAGIRLGWLGFDWTPAVTTGFMWARRTIEVPQQQTVETLTGVAVGLSLSVERAFGSQLLAGLRIEGGALAASILDRDVHPLASAALWIGLQL